jgi:HD-GYP domain-containing protein (c-di-GMP phosphodiesterase class II)
MVLAAPISYPTMPDRILLNAGFCFDALTLQQLQRFAVQVVWIQHPGFDFLDARLSDVVPQSRSRLYESVKRSFSDLASRTAGDFNLADYRTVVGNLICALVADRKHAVFAERIFGSHSELFAHSANVAYLALLIGMRARNYIATQRKHVTCAQAEDLTNLGLGAMFHDVGKLALDDSAQLHHVVDGAADEAYQLHPEKGFRALRGKLEATAAAAILHHHQCFNGRGFPAPRKRFQERQVRSMAGMRIHIFARVVAVANLLDALISTCQQEQRPIVSALWGIQNEPFVAMLDPIVLQAALACIPPFPLSTCVQLADGRNAVIVDLNESNPCRPKVRILNSGRPSEPPGEEVDLAAPDAPAIASVNDQPVTAYTDWGQSVAAHNAARMRAAAISRLHRRPPGAPPGSAETQP